MYSILKEINHIEILLSENLSKSEFIQIIKEIGPFIAEKSEINIILHHQKIEKRLSPFEDFKDLIDEVNKNINPHQTLKIAVVYESSETLVNTSFFNTMVLAEGNFKYEIFNHISSAKKWLLGE